MHHGDARIMLLLGAGAVPLLAIFGCDGGSTGDPPDGTITIIDGKIKHVGMRS